MQNSRRAARQSPAAGKGAFVWRLVTALSVGVFLFGTLFLGYLLYGAARTLAASIPVQSGAPLPAIIASRQPDELPPI